MADIITPPDLQVFNPDLSEAKANEMISDALAEAYRVAPCLKTVEDPDILASAKAVLRRAILRWADSGTGALQQWSNTDGPFGRSATIDTRVSGSVGLFYPSEESKLRDLCASSSGSAPRSGMRWIL